MKNRFAVLRALFLLMLCLGAYTAAVAVENKGAADIKLAGGSRGDVPFPHHLHQSALENCEVCHAVFPQERGAIERLKAEKTLKKKKVMNGQCVKCHRAKKKAGEKTGPVKCARCHEKP